MAPGTGKMTGERGLCGRGAGAAEAGADPELVEVTPALVDSIREELRQTIDRLRTLLDRLERGSR